MEEGEPSSPSLPLGCSKPQHAGPNYDKSYFTKEKLSSAALLGDVKFLEEALSVRSSLPTDYFLCSDHDQYKVNMMFIATMYGNEEFIRVALEGLPTQVSLSLLCDKTDWRGYVPLHKAAQDDQLGIVKLMVNFYKKLQSESGDHRCPPWLAKDEDGETPLQKTTNREIASYLLDMTNPCDSMDEYGSNPIYYAVIMGFDRIAENILESGCQCSLVGGQDRFTVLHVVTNSSEKVCELLLEKHPELLNNNDNTKGYTVLHQWAIAGKLWPLQLLVRWNVSYVLELMHKVDYNGDCPLHIAIRGGRVEFAKAFNDAYTNNTSRGMDPTNLAEYCPWTTQSKDGNTPFLLALSECQFIHEQEWLIKNMSENPSVCHIRNNLDFNPLIRGVQNGYNKVVKEILKLSDRELISMPLMPDGTTVLHYFVDGDRCSEETGELLLEKFWWLINKTDKEGNTPIAKATKVRNGEYGWVFNLFARVARNPDSIKRAPFDWIAASKESSITALLAYMDHCPDFLKICLELNDTPLHHIKLKNSNEYQQFLEKPIIKEMKNIRDQDDATPLHRALERQDKALVEALLSLGGVNKNMLDKNKKTAMDLLAELADQDPEWEEMCTRIIGINPRLKTRYIHPTNKNLGEIRATLSVIAALLATLTFAAGFTVPGGFKSDVSKGDAGEAFLAKEPSFVAFLLADTFAMCCSMLVLFFLMWSMVSNPDMAVTLIDSSVMILMLALYGTLVAFMTGVYTYIFHKSLWAAIVIFFMCCLIVVLANKTILFKVLNKLVPAVNKKRRDQTRLLEQGQAFEHEATPLREVKLSKTN